MKKLLFLFGLLLISIIGFSQANPISSVTISDARTEAVVLNTLSIKGGLNPPHRDTNFIAVTFGQIVIRPADSLAYISTGLTGAGLKHWTKFGAATGTPGATWGSNIGGDISTQLDLQAEFSTKQNILPAGTTAQYWDATGVVRTFPSIPAQINLTSPNSSISIGGVYPNITLQNTITNLNQLINGPGYITGNQTTTISGAATGSGTTSIPIVLSNTGVSAGTCTNCSLTIGIDGRISVQSSGTGSNLITSVFTRTGAVVAVSGDYTAAQVTNAVDQTGSYTNPTWLVSIPFTKLTAKPTTIAGYGITDALVNTFNTRSGAVTLSSGDVTTALGFTPVTNARTLTINGTTFDLTVNRTWTIGATGTLSRVSPIDSLGANANGIQVSNISIVPSTATSGNPGMESSLHWRTTDSIHTRLFLSNISLGHAGAGLWGAYSNVAGTILNVKNWANGKYTIAVTGTDSSNHYDLDTAANRTYLNGYYLPLTANITINGTTSALSTNPSFTIAGGTPDTAKSGVAGLMSAYNWAKTQHPLITINDTSFSGSFQIFHSNFDSLFSKAIVPGYGLGPSFQTLRAIYLILDTARLSTRSWRDKLGDSLAALISLRQLQLNGTGYVNFSGTTPSYKTPTQVTADLNVFTSSLKGLVPASGGNATTYLDGSGNFSTPAGTGSGVTTFKGRAGVVVPASGDYTAAQVTNAADITSTYSNPSWITTLAWSKISTTPTTLAGYGITDALVLTFKGRSGAVVAASGDYTAAQVTNAADITSSYSNPTWITALAWSKIGTTPTTLSGYGITDPIVLTSGSYSNPSWITTLAWSKIATTPTTLSGYGITDPIVLTSGSYADPGWITSLASSKITGVHTVAQGGTAVSTFTAGYVKSPGGTTALTTVSTIPGSDISGSIPGTASGITGVTLSNVFNGYQAISSGTTATINKNNVVFTFATGVSNFTLTTPASPIDGMTFDIDQNIFNGNQIGALTITANTGSALIGLNPLVTTNNAASTAATAFPIGSHIHGQYFASGTQGPVWFLKLN